MLFSMVHSPAIAFYSDPMVPFRFTTSVYEKQRLETQVPMSSWKGSVLQIIAIVLRQRDSGQGGILVKRDCGGGGGSSSEQTERINSRKKEDS